MSEEESKQGSTSEQNAGKEIRPTPKQNIGQDKKPDLIGESASDIERIRKGAEIVPKPSKPTEDKKD